MTVFHTRITLMFFLCDKNRHTQYHMNIILIIIFNSILDGSRVGRCGERRHECSAKRETTSLFVVVYCYCHFLCYCCLFLLFDTLQEETKLLFVIVYSLLLLLQIGVCTEQVKYITNFILLTIKNTIV